MRLIGCAFALATLPCMLSARSTSRTYWLMTRDDGLWCGYKNEAAFKAKVDKAPPLESAKLTYVSDTLREVTYQAQAESGDWIVIDQYTLTDNGTVLRRANVFAGQELEVVQEAAIRNGKAEPLRAVSAAPLDPKQKADTVDLDYPDLPAVTNLNGTRYVTLAAFIRRSSVVWACEPTKPQRMPPPLSSRVNDVRHRTHSRDRSYTVSRPHMRRSQFAQSFWPPPRLPPVSGTARWSSVDRCRRVAGRRLRA